MTFDDGGHWQVSVSGNAHGGGGIMRIYCPTARVFQFGASQRYVNLHLSVGEMRELAGQLSEAADETRGPGMLSMRGWAFRYGLGRR